MSVTFSVVLPGVPGPDAGDDAFATLAGAVSAPIATRDDTTRWPPGLLKVFSPDRSTRPVEIDVDGARFETRVLVCATVEDHLLAVDLVRQAARLWEGDSFEFEGEPVAPDTLADRFDRRWAEAEVAAGAEAVLRTAADLKPGQSIRLAGAVRDFVLGPRLLAELREGRDEELTARLMAAIHRTQWPGECWQASVMKVTDSPGAEARRFAVLSPGTRTLLPDVDLVAVRTGDGSMAEIPPDRLVAASEGRARYLDEGRVLVEALAEDELAALIRAAT